MKYGFSEIEAYIVHTLICCNMAAGGLTNIYAQHAAPERECGYISKTPSTTVLQHLYKILKSIVAL